MSESLITTELENAILKMRYQPAGEWANRASSDPVAEERELNMRAARRILDVFYDLSQEFTRIELGLVD